MSWLRRTWQGFEHDERIALLACAALLAFFAGFGHAQRRAEQPLPPLFVEAPAAPSESEKPGGNTLQAASAGDTPTARAASRVAARPIIVHVAGAVRRPGVQRQPAGARVIDAVRAAGGATARGDVQTLNLAQRLHDGERIVVPQRDAVVAPAVVAQAQASASLTARGRAAPFTGVVNVNAATAQELESLPGVGPAIALRIVAHRSQKGRFGSLEDLDEVKGLGPKKLQALRDHVTF